MKTKTIATATLAALILAVVATAAFASSGSPGGASSAFNPFTRGDSNNHGQGFGHGHSAACDNLTVGETLTVSGLTGRYLNASDRTVTGNASGTFTFMVNGTYAEGCTLSITSGTISINSTAYTVTGGSIVLNHGGRSGTGSGTTSSGSFLINIAGLHGNSTSTNAGAIGLDFETGTSQFLVHLHSPAALDDADGSD